MGLVDRNHSTTFHVTTALKNITNVVYIILKDDIELVVLTPNKVGEKEWTVEYTFPFFSTLGTYTTKWVFDTPEGPISASYNIELIDNPVIFSWITQDLFEVITIPEDITPLLQ